MATVKVMATVLALAMAMATGVAVVRGGDGHARRDRDGPPPFQVDSPRTPPRGRHRHPAAVTATPLPRRPAGRDTER
jgi:hypothetical protein